MSLPSSCLQLHRQLCMARATRHVSATSVNSRPLRASPWTTIIRRNHRQEHRQRNKGAPRKPEKAQASSSSLRPSQTYQDPSTAYVSALAASSTTTLLYRSTTSAVFQQTCYAIGGLWLTWSAWEFYEVVLTPHPGLGLLVPLAVFPICIAGTTLGLWILYACKRLIGSISTVPIGKEAHEKSVMVRIQGRTLFPWSTPREMNVRPQALYLPSSIEEVRNPDPGAMSRAKTEAGRRALRMEKADRERAKNPTMATGFMNVLRAIPATFRKILLREGLMSVFVRTDDGVDVKWRMDVNTGWLLNDGFPIERLARKHRNG